MFGRAGPKGADAADELAALRGRIEALEQRDKAATDLLLPGLWTTLARLYEGETGQGSLTCLACAQTASPASFGVREDRCVFGGGLLKRFECPACGCVFGPQWYLDTPSEVIDADYRQLYLNYREADSTDDEIRAFHLLDPKPEGVYLNWGSGAWSRSVQTLREHGWEVWGYEPHAQTDSPFIVRDRAEISARFDGIFSNNVIEHFFDPAAQFADFHDVLKPGGRMVHASPCYAWAYAYTRFHVFFPMGDAPARLAARTGYALDGRVEDGDFRACLFRAI
ncbi:class I SAM-dependent methyltransferase [Caulobacter sp. NIBR2454]|uniref:class I SAM-dependent methyltransferase n=1 Tax=Caulobacter sp. NIBR2454 TaxID=3015996 RepID=UPI0022B66DB1|nr:methyltransferase domain-containing protein [Caulobacter sp. NIBR2454]